MTDTRDVRDQINMTIGEVCGWWNGLDSIIHDISLHLGWLHHDAFEQKAVWDVLNIALCTMEIRQKIATAKALSHQIDCDDSPDFYNRAAELLNYVDNVLRPERNRYIHDSWQLDSDEIVRVMANIGVHKPQARQRELRLRTERRYGNIEAASGFLMNLELAYRDLCDLDNHIAWLFGRKERTSIHLQPLPPVWQSLAHRDWRKIGTP